MIALIQAIEAYFAANTPLKAAFPPYNNTTGSPASACNVWQDLLPENAVLPACVYSVISSVADAIYNSSNTYAPSTNSFRFTAYAVGKNAAITAAQTLQAQLDIAPATMVLSGGTINNWVRRSEPVPQWDSKSKNEIDVWGCSLVYDISVDPLPP